MRAGGFSVKLCLASPRGTPFCVNFRAQSLLFIDKDSIFLFVHWVLRNLLNSYLLFFFLISTIDNYFSQFYSLGVGMVKFCEHALLGCRLLCLLVFSSEDQANES